MRTPNHRAHTLDVHSANGSINRPRPLRIAKPLDGLNTSPPPCYVIQCLWRVVGTVSGYQKDLCIATMSQPSTFGVFTGGAEAAYFARFCPFSNPKVCRRYSRQAKSHGHRSPYLLRATGDRSRGAAIAMRSSMDLLSTTMTPWFALVQIVVTRAGYAHYCNPDRNPSSLEVLHNLLSDSYSSS
jgi:hypothetical protein